MMEKLQSLSASLQMVAKHLECKTFISLAIHSRKIIAVVEPVQDTHGFCTV